MRMVNAAGELRVGYASIDITPAPGAGMSGYGYDLNRRVRSVLDPLHARALVAEQGDTRFVLVCCDLLGLDAKTVACVTEELANDVSPDHLMLVCTHTHTGPTTDILAGCGDPNPGYLPVLRAAIVECVWEALDDLTPVRGMRACEREIDPVSHNRAREDGPLDAAVRGALITREGAPDIAIVNYACHPTTFGRSDAVSADYPGRVVHHLEQRGMRAIFLNGPCGDINPIQSRDAWGKGTFDTITENGVKIAEGFLAGLREETMPPILRTLVIEDELANQPLTRADCERHVELVRARVPEGAPELRIVREWARRRMEQGPVLEKLRLRCARLGSLALIAFPYEAFTVVGMNARARLPGFVTLCMGNAEKVLGYLPSREDIACGGYASLSSAYLYDRQLVLPGEAERLGDAVGAALCEALTAPL